MFKLVIQIKSLLRLAVTLMVERATLLLSLNTLILSLFFKENMISVHVLLVVVSQDVVVLQLFLLEDGQTLADMHLQVL